MNKFYRIWFLALFVKCLLSVWLPLSNDEAYYWVWGHHLSLSYFDHPPVVGWLFWLGSFFENLGHAARLPGVILGHITILVWHYILRPFLDEKQQWLWLIFVSFSPFLGVGSLIITPDVPLMFFWSLSLLALLRCLSLRSAVWYLAFGATLGLGFCSKYMIVVFVPVALLWLAASGKWRRVQWRFVPLTLLSGILFSGPVLIWNFEHEWASFVFQLGHGLNSDKQNLMWPVEYLLAQIMILFPTVVWLALRRREPGEARFLHFFGWFPLLFFLYTSFRARVEANWPIMAHPALLSLAFLNMKSWRPFKWTIGIWAFALIAILSQVAFSWIPLDPHKLKTSEFTKYDVFLPEVAEHPDMFMGSYQMAAAVSYKLRRQFYKLKEMNRRDFYDYIPESTPKGDRFFVGAEITLPLPKWVEKEGFEVVNEKILNEEFRVLEVVRREKDPRP